ncbi:MAG: glutamine--fructose-6-phosphate transaminase (isomerizing) [Kiritimatiellae bacterium]|nr:glutamine--fructose-6-phosphate transaminase (isomerizing) [Kiritimatiellia bacterium]
MCGIVGYVGPRDAVPLLVEGLKRLEYRGYDSAGLAVLSASELVIRKCVGRLADLEDLLEREPARGTPGIGHTRWATHGAPSEANAHPHTSRSGRIAVVHNGIIENYQDLREELETAGYAFASETDTEVLPHLIERELKNGAKDLAEALRRALARARGAYAVGVLSADEPEAIYAAREGSPLIIGLGDGEHFIASDVPAILKHVTRVVYLNDGEIARLTRDGISIERLDGTPVQPDIKKITLQAEAADRAGFETFMLKEIHEQPRVIRSLLDRHVRGPHDVALDLGRIDTPFLAKLRRMMIVSCGTAYYAGLYGKLLLEHLTSVAVETDLGSEFRYRDAKFDRDTLIVAVSQSGETADTLASVRMARERGCRVLTICNVQGSSLTRESDGVIYTEAGPEIGVASTKAFTAQLAAFALFALHLGRLRNELSAETASTLIEALQKVPHAIHYVLDRKADIAAIAAKHHDGPSALYLGRRFNYPIALEGALKNKEISYQHAEGYAAGEMKHGPIALINEYLPVVCLCTRTRDALYDKMVSNMKEVEARHGRIIAVVNDGDRVAAALAEDIIHVPEICEEFSPLVNVVALQLLAYYAAHARGTDIDKPRNLAKSVTVE